MNEAKSFLNVSTDSPTADTTIRFRYRLILMICAWVIAALVVVAIPLTGCGGVLGSQCDCFDYYLSSWDARSGELEWSIEIPRNKTFAVSEDLQRLATLEWPRMPGQGALVAFRDTASGQVVREIELPTEDEVFLQAGDFGQTFSPDLRWLVVHLHNGFRDYRGKTWTYRLFDLDTGEVKGTFDHTNWTGFSGDSRRLFTYSPDSEEISNTRSEAGVVTSWDLETMTEVSSYRMEAAPVWLHSATGQLMVTWHDSVIWQQAVVDAETGEVTGNVDLLLTNRDLTWSKEWAEATSRDSTVVIRGGTAHAIRGLEEEPIRMRVEEDNNTVVYWAVLSPGGDLLMCKSASDPYESRAPDRIEVWDRRRGELLYTADDDLLLGSTRAVFITENRFLTLGPPCYCPSSGGL